MYCIMNARFFVKHPEFTKSLRDWIRSDNELKNNSVVIDYLEFTAKLPLKDKYYFIGDTEKNPNIYLNEQFRLESDTSKISSTAIEIVNRMNNIYSKYLKLINTEHNYRPQLISIDDRSQ